MFAKDKLALLLLLVAILSGCATYSWRHPTRSADDLNKDKYACMQQAAQTFPVVLQQRTYGTGYMTPAETTCTPGPGGQTHCVTKPAIYHPPTVSAVDMNQDNRNEAFSACMRAGGWSLQKDQ